MASADPSTDEAAADSGEVAALAARLGIALPPECVPGVRHHVALLDQHWRNLRSFVLPQA